jgi:small subunit ribosomal protein S16
MRLARHGSKKNPIYRIVVADAKSPRDGSSVETIGRYNPQLEPSLIEIDAERAKHWLERGAQPSEPVRRLLQKQGILERGR